MAGMLLLAKTKKDGLGKFFSFISYLVIIISLLMLVCQCGRGVMRMTCCRGMHPPMDNCMMEKECCRGGGMMMHHEWMGGHEGRCMEEMKECRMGAPGCEPNGMKGDSASCKMGMMHGCPMMGGGKDGKSDTAKKNNMQMCGCVNVQMPQYLSFILKRSIRNKK